MFPDEQLNCSIPASLDGHLIEEAGLKPGLVSYPQYVEGQKIRERSPSFDNHNGSGEAFLEQSDGCRKGVYRQSAAV